MDYSPLDSSIYGVSQARIWEWVAISSSRGFSWPRNQTIVIHIYVYVPTPLLLLLLLSRFSRVRLCTTQWTAAHQAPPSLGISRQEQWTGLPFPSPMHESEKWKVKAKSLSRVRLLATSWTSAYQAPPSMWFSRQKYWSGLLFLPPGDLPNPGIRLSPRISGIGRPILYH